MVEEVRPSTTPHEQPVQASTVSAQPQAPPGQPARRQLSSSHSHVFNVPKAGRPRPEHHGARGTAGSQTSTSSSGFREPKLMVGGMTLGPSQVSSGFKQPASLSTSNNGFKKSPLLMGGMPVGSSQSSSQPSGSKSSADTSAKYPILDDDLFTPVDAWSSRGSRAVPAPVPRFSGRPTMSSSSGPNKPYKAPIPTNDLVQDRPAAKQQLYSSGSALPFDPYHMPRGAHVVDLTKPYSRPKPQMEVVNLDDFMDHEEANEKLKSLLEGNLGGDDIDEDDEQTDEVAAITSGLKQSLHVSDKDKPEAAAEPEPSSPAKKAAPEDDGTRPGLNVKLLTHQIQGVKWMNQKETGGKKKKGSHPRGGILADDMGLGKTLQTIATIVTNPRPEKDSEEAKKRGIKPVTGRCTLIVLPLPLLQQWEGEIKKFVDPGLNYKVLVHYGPKRQMSGSGMLKSDIVLTTYETLVSDYGNSNFSDNGKRVACFEVDWYRVVLDEAHRIKNPSTKQSKACCALKSHYRWCLTGTPMQNKLDEIQTLIKFLAIEPYNDMRHWKDQITKPMGNGKGGIAMRRVQILLKAILLRRTKDLLREKGELKTVERRVEEVVAEFSEQERKVYDNLEDRMANTIDRMGSKLNYANALVLLLRLRQACNHTELVKTELDKDKDALMTGNASPSKGAANSKDVDVLADAFGTLDMGGASLGSNKCRFCGTELTSAETQRSGKCRACESDFGGDQTASSTPMKERKRDKKTKRGKKEKKKEARAVEEEQRKQRNNRRIVDDEDEDEGEGDWIGSGDEQITSGLGRAGGIDDENAEGGGESLGEDSDSDEDDDDDDDDEEDDVVSRTHSGRARRLQIDSDGESEQEFEDHKNGDFGKMKKVKQRIRPSGLDSDSESDDDDDSAGSDSDSDSDESIRGPSSRSRLAPSTPKPSSSSSRRHSTANSSLTSAKIRALMNIIHRESKSHKVIIFSSFVSMLRLIEPFLLDSGIRFSHYNGQMRNDQREASLTSLRDDRHTRVLLCSLKSGALGLNLTAASRVVLVEPFWNPFVEEQAIDRVHRIGQRQDVVVYKLTVGETVEQRIVALQEKKRELARMALESGAKVAGAGALTMQQVLALFKRGAEHEEEEGVGGAGGGGGGGGGDPGVNAGFREGGGGLLRKGAEAMGALATSSRVRHNARSGYEGARGGRKPEDPIWGRR